MVHDPPIRTLILTDISCAVQIKLIIMRFSSAYSHAFVLRLTLRLLMSYIQGVPGGKDLTSGECFLGQTIPI